MLHANEAKNLGIGVLKAEKGRNCVSIGEARKELGQSRETD